MRSLILILSLVSASVFAEPVLKFSKEFNSSTESNATDIVNSPTGLYVTGYIDRDKLIDESGTPPATPVREGFLAGFDNDGNETLFVKFGDQTILPDIPTAMTISNSCHIYITGKTGGDINGSIGGFGNYDIFIAKFDNVGNLNWIRQVGTDENDEAFDIVTDSAGDIYVAGAEYNSSETASNQVIYKLNIDGGDVFKHIYQDRAFTSDRIKLRFDGIKDQLYIVRSAENTVDNIAKTRIEIMDKNGSLTADHFAFGEDTSDILIDFDFVTRDDNRTEFFPVILRGTSMPKVKKFTLEINGTFTHTVTGAESYIDGDRATAIQYVSETDSLLVSSIKDGNSSIYNFSTQELNTSSKLSTYGNSLDTVVNSFTADSNGTIFLTGDKTITNGDSNMFLAKVENQVIKLHLPAGWNLISGNIDKASLTKDIVILYQYSNLNQEWQAYSPDSGLNSALQTMTPMPQVTDINNSEGTWVLSEVAHDLILNSNDLNISTLNYPNGWSLNGIGHEVNASTASLVMCNSGSAPTSIWKYIGEWQVNLPDSTIFTDIKRFDSILPNEGFWIDCQ